MDSGSGSMQSSSGGDEEYDSRAESISAFLNNNNPSSHVGPMPNPPQPPQPPPQQHYHQTHSSSSSMFDPLSNYFDPLSRSSNSLLNLDMVWSKTLRSEPNCTDLGGFIPTSSPTQHFLTNQQSRAAFPGCVQIPHQGPDNNICTTRGSVSGSDSVSGTNDQTPNTTNNNMVRNPKKRSRASRRAPTTVLTTDTTNFRTMVQEFTGIPAPPFTSSPFPRTRFDLFASSSSTFRPHLDPSPPPYLLRPFPQKLHPPNPFASSSSSSSSSFVDAITSTTNITSGSGSGSATNNSASANSSSINYRLPSDHLSLLKAHQPHQDLLNLNTRQNNPILNFHSLLHKYPLPNSGPNLANKPQGSLDNIPSSSDSHLKMGVLEEFGLSHDNNSNNNPANWGDGAAGGSNENDQEGLLRSINGNYSNSHRVTNGRVNYSASSSSDFHGDKGTENVTAARSEGMVESWICSSD